MDDEAGNCYVVTTYIPSPDLWSDRYRTRRESSWSALFARTDRHLWGLRPLSWIEMKPR